MLPTAVGAVTDPWLGPTELQGSWPSAPTPQTGPVVARSLAVPSPRLAAPLPLPVLAQAWPGRGLLPGPTTSGPQDPGITPHASGPGGQGPSLPLPSIPGQQRWS